MVFLTITPTILDAIEEIQRLDQNTTQDVLRIQALVDETSIAENNKSHGEAIEEMSGSYEGHKDTEDVQISHGDGGSGCGSNEPSLSSPKLGNPISHGQVIELWNDLKTRSPHPRTLDSLLRGSRVYNPPPGPKPSQTSEYKALMARLRRDEEERTYHRMTNPAPPMETFAQRFPLSSAAHAFASSYQPLDSSKQDEDDVTYADVNRQVTLIFNVLVSIIACAGAIWVVARWWSTPARLAVSLGGSLLVGIAEVVVYTGYIRKVSESKKQERGLKEVKEVVNTWVVGAGEEVDQGDAGEKSTPIKEKLDDGDFKARRRKKDAK